MERGEKLALLDRLEQRYPDEGMRGLVRELRQRIERESDGPLDTRARDVQSNGGRSLTTGFSS